MVTIDIDSAIFLYIGLLLGTILPVWILMGRHKRHTRRSDMVLRDKNNQRTCEICLFEYIDSDHSDLSKCPQCGHLNE